MIQLYKEGMLCGKDYVYTMGKCSNLMNTWIGAITISVFPFFFLLVIYEKIVLMFLSRLFDSAKAMAFSNVPSRDWVI